MNVVNITEAEMNQTAVNNVIQGMVDLIPPCEDPISPNFNEPGQCDYTDVFTSYETDIQPIFNDNCTQCHGSSSSNGLSLDTYDNLMSNAVVSLNDGANSTIYQRMTSSTNPMPPSGLIDSYLAERIKAWIDQGASECAQGEDCAEVCGGTSIQDMCQTCDDDFSNDCTQDCNGDWGGSLVDDECGICGGDNLTCTDCNDELNGSSLIDGCDECVAEGDTSCTQGCDGNWSNDGSQLLNDECGICGGSGPELNFDCNGNCLVELDCNGDCGGTDDESCLSIDNPIPESFSINSIYPNPFNPVVNIEYSIATSNLVNISIYDLSGQLVDHLFSGNQVVGNYHISWDASEMSSGIYLITIQSGNILLSDQLILLK